MSVYREPSPRDHYETAKRLREYSDLFGVKTQHDQDIRAVLDALAVSETARVAAEERAGNMTNRVEQANVAIQRTVKERDEAKRSNDILEKCREGDKRTHRRRWDIIVSLVEALRWEARQGDGIAEQNMPAYQAALEELRWPFDPVTDHVAAPSPSSRAEEPVPVAWRVMRGVAMTYTARTKQDAERMSAFTADSRVEPLFAAPPDLAAEIAKLKAERDAEAARANGLFVDLGGARGSIKTLREERTAQDAEIAKLKAEVALRERERQNAIADHEEKRDGAARMREALERRAEAAEVELAKLKIEVGGRYLRAQLDGTRREFVSEYWKLAKSDIRFPNKEAARHTRELWKDSARSLNAGDYGPIIRVTRYRVKPKPAGQR